MPYTILRENKTGSHRTSHHFFISINPAQQVPAMQEIDENTAKVFTMSESHAMMRYLTDSRGLPDHWYPKNLRKRASLVLETRCRRLGFQKALCTSDDRQSFHR